MSLQWRHPKRGIVLKNSPPPGGRGFSEPKIVPHTAEVQLRFVTVDASIATRCSVLALATTGQQSFEHGAQRRVGVHTLVEVCHRVLNRQCAIRVDVRDHC